MLLFIVLIAYYEILFRYLVGIKLEPESFLITMLFSISVGFLLCLLSGISGNDRINRFFTGVLLIFIPMVYLIQFFVYRSFNVFYDINTMNNGAGQAFTEFGADMKRIVLSSEGILSIALFFLPTILWGVAVAFGRHKVLVMPRSALSGLIMAVCSLAFFVIGRMAVNRSVVYEPMYTTEYNYQNVVCAMGLATGIRLDLIKSVSGRGDDFEIAEDVNDSKSIYPDTGGNSDSKVSADQDADSDIVNNSGSDTQELLLPENHVVGKNEAKETESAGETDDMKAVDENTADDDDGLAAEESFLPNTLDIDFKALSESASGEQKKLDLYVDQIEPTMQNKYTGLFKGKNLIFFSAEAFSGYIIDPELTPALYRLATKGIQIPDYYQPAIAGTTGGEYSNLFGMLPMAGGKSMKMITEHNTWITIGNRLDQEGYYGRAYHDSKMSVYDRDVTHERLGYSDGYVGVGNGMEKYLHTTGFPASDLEMLQGTFPTYVDRQPFNIYYMTVSGHGQYGKSINQMAAKNYERVADVDHSEIVKCYLACNIPLEDAMAWLLDELEKRGIADDTVIVVSADHFPYNLDTGALPGNMPNLSELYGFNVTNYLERDSNRLIIWSGCLEKMDPIVVDNPVFSLDILPTLCNLFGVPFESRLLPGRDIFSDKDALVFDGSYDWKTNIGTYIASKNTFIPASEEVVIPEDYVKTIKNDVRNRMNYCKGVLNCGYYDHVFGYE